MTSVTNFVDLVAQHGTLARTFPRAYSFPTLLSAVCHIFYWTLLVILREAIYETSLLLPNSPETHTNRGTRAKAADDIADSICMSVPYLLATRNPTVMGSRVVCGPLQFAQSWYRRRGADNKAAWCESVTRKLSRQLSAQSHWVFMQKILVLPRGLVG